MTTVRIENLRRSFGSVTALDGIDLEIEDGENIAILGPSGSGKSTLLRVVAGLESADEGDVLFDGFSQRNTPPHLRDAAIVFQHFALYPHLSALENITLGLRHGLGLSRGEAVQRAHEIAARMQVEHLLSRRPKEMSGGQRQRIALARALARRSGIVLLDEPLSGLDAQLHAVLRLEIASLLRSVGATGINVTHDQMDAMAMADRIAVLNNGRIEQLGTPDELYAAPATLFVASFIGTPPMNLLAIDGDGRSSFDGDAGLSRSGTTLGVRAEDLEPVPAGTVGALTITGVVGLIEPAGRDRVVQMLTENGDTVAFRCEALDCPRPGERVTVAMRPERVHVYDTASGLHTGALRSAELFAGAVL
ncbi:ABC transporter ATP-binding protein [Microbacterium oxydans]|uniref:ABC transporter ATP-binding protein n=1 Tax=Microbacterium oxydans TaxID=82380 RepID=UPI00226B1C4F|nr:ABC transporter ATP-binding protein [Microbacterium oxydans]WAA67520.1 ABC transporter ATP-binding protein [Microbacterium oxydans]